MSCGGPHRRPSRRRGAVRGAAGAGAQRARVQVACRSPARPHGAFLLDAAPLSPLLSVFGYSAAFEQCCAHFLYSLKEGTQDTQVYLVAREKALY